MENKDFQVCRQITRRKDGMARVTGQEQYTTDIVLPRMLHGRMVCAARTLMPASRASIRERGRSDGGGRA